MENTFCIYLNSRKLMIQRQLPVGRSRVNMKYIILSNTSQNV